MGSGSNRWVFLRKRRHWGKGVDLTTFKTNGGKKKGSLLEKKFSTSASERRSPHVGAKKKRRVVGAVGWPTSVPNFGSANGVRGFPWRRRAPRNGVYRTPRNFGVKGEWASRKVKNTGKRKLRSRGGTRRVCSSTPRPKAKKKTVVSDSRFPGKVFFL